MCSQSLALLTIREYQLCVVSCKVYQARFPQCLRNCLEEVSKPCLYCNNPEASSTSVGPLPGNSCADPEYVCVCVGGGGGQGSCTPTSSPPHPLKDHKIKGFLAILVRIHRKITKLPSQHSMLGHHPHASETSFKWHFTGRPMMASL